MRKNQLLAALYSAWELLLDIPVPKRLLTTSASIRPPAVAILLALPFIGLLCGALIVLALKITALFLANFGNAVLYAIVLLIFILAKDSGRGFRLVMELCHDLAAGNRKIAEILPLLRLRKLSEIHDLASNLCAFAVCGFLLSAFTYLAYNGATLWAVPVLMMGTAVQGHLLSLRNVRGGLPFLAIAESERNKLWVLTGFLMLFPAIEFPLAVLVSFGLCFVLAAAARKFFEELYGGATSEMITLVGIAAELLTLFCGILLINN